MHKKSARSSIIQPRMGPVQQFFYDFRLYKKHLALVLMLLPVIVYFLIFKYGPMGGIVIAFKDYNIKMGVWGSPWNGIENFRVAFSTANFQRAVANTLIISLLKLVFGFPMPILLAIFLNEIRHNAFKRTIQTISYLPHFLSWVVLAGIFTNILSPSTGMVNHILVNLFGMSEPIYFLGNPATFRPTLIVTDIWKSVGWSSILYLANIAGIDAALYEAAMCDGASRWQRMRHITLPSLMPTIAVLLILNVGSIMDAGFDQVFNLYNPGVYSTGDIIDTYVYRYGITDMKYSLATAVGLFKNVIGFILVIGTNFITKKIGDYGLW